MELKESKIWTPATQIGPVAVTTDTMQHSISLYNNNLSRGQKGGTPGQLRVRHVLLIMQDTT